VQEALEPAAPEERAVASPYRRRSRLAQGFVAYIPLPKARGEGPGIEATAAADVEKLYICGRRARTQILQSLIYLGFSVV
jgi:hypothetical protein